MVFKKCRNKTNLYGSVLMMSNTLTDESRIWIAVCYVDVTGFILFVTDVLSLLFA